MQEFVKQRKRDFFYRKAKLEKYRSRAAYKLLDLQKRFHLIKKGNVVVDLGAAPGSWSQIALEFVGKNGLVIGIDVLSVLGLGGGFTFVQGDIFKAGTLEKIKQALPRAADVILSDAAPAFSGIRSRDVGIAMQLSFKALEIAKEILKPNGNFITKAFRGQDYTDFVSEVKKNFAAVKEVKPPASQKESAEIYIVGLKFKKEMRPSEKIK